MTTRIITAAVFSLLLALSASYAEKTKEAKKKTPEVITKNIKKILPGFKIEEFESDNDDGDMLYFIKGKYNNHEYELLFKEDGTIIEVRREDNRDYKEKVPATITKNIEKILPGFKIKDFEPEIVDGDIFYLIEGEYGNLEYEMVFKKDGTIIQLEYRD